MLVFLCIPLLFQAVSLQILDPQPTADTGNKLLLDDVIDLRHRLAIVESSVSQLQTQVAQKNSQIIALENAVNGLNNQLNDSHIAFSVILDKSLNSLHVDQSITFNKVLTDVGGNYHPTSGHFTAPVAGTYLFTWHTQTLHTAQGSSLTTCLSVNGQCKLHAYANANSEHGSDIQPDGNTAILPLYIGDVVWISVQSGANLYSNIGQKWFYPSFSGYKLF